MTEVWLRGPVEGIQPLLQPAAHALLQVREEIVPLALGLTTDQLWSRPGGAPSIGFHLAHLSGSLDRLLTYSRGETLSPAQLETLKREETIDGDRPELARLIAAFDASVSSALNYFRQLSAEALLVPREVGRQRLPSSTFGLVFHAAEHASRHAGQIVTLRRLVICEVPG